jgi:hypothetical protein
MEKVKLMSSVVLNLSHLPFKVSLLALATRVAQENRLKTEKTE